MIWELMKAQRTGIYPDLRTKYIADAFKNTSSTITEMSGELPLAFATTGLPLTNYKAYGNAVQAATPSPDNPAEVQAVGDKTANLFNGTIEQGGIGSYDGSLTSMSTRVRTPKISVEENAVYTISSNLPIRNIVAYKNNTYTRSVYDNPTTATNIKSFEIPVGSNQIAVSFKGNIAGNIDITPADISDLTLNEGNIPHGYKIPFTTAAEDGTESITTTVYLDKPLYKIGDYADTLCYAEQKVERVINELILTGKEEWRYKDGSGGFLKYYALDNISPFKAENTEFCTHYSSARISASNENVGVGVQKTDKGKIYSVLFRPANISLEDVEAWKTYLAEQYANGMPVRVYYILEEPESESVELPKLPTLDGVTVIDAATEIKPSKMDIKYTGHRLLMFSRRD